MKNLSIAVLVALSLVSVAACKKKGGDALGKMTEFKDLMCKCGTDKACADKVATDYAKAMADMGGGEMKAPDAEEAKKYAPIMKEYTDCMMKAQGMGGMAPPPAGDKPAAAPPAGDKPADPAAAPPAGDKPADPAAAPPAPPAGDKPAAGSN